MPLAVAADRPDPFLRGGQFQPRGAVAFQPLDADQRGGLAGIQHHRRVPAGNIARHLDRGQQLAPVLALPPGDRVDPDHRAAIDRPAAVVCLQPAAQRAGGNLLKLGIDGGADGQAALVEIVLAQLGDELAAHLLAEIARPGVGQNHRALLADDGLQRTLHGGIGRIAAQMAVLRHLLQHVVPPRHRPVVFAHRVQVRRRLRQRRQIGGVFGRQLLQRLAEIALGGGDHAIGVLKGRTR